MSKNWEELTEEFCAVSEDGRLFHLLVFTTMTDASSMSNPNAAPLKGLKRVCTSDGQNCSHVGDDTFDTKLQSIDNLWYAFL
jgi:hypothetical protein